MARGLDAIIRALEIERASKQADYERVDARRRSLEQGLEVIDQTLASAQDRCAEFNLTLRMVGDSATHRLEHQRASIEEHRNAVIANEVEPAREMLVEANVRVRTIERLRERRQQAALARRAREEQERLDESAGARWLRG